MFQVSDLINELAFLDSLGLSDTPAPAREAVAVATRLREERARLRGQADTRTARQRVVSQLATGTVEMDAALDEWAATRASAAAAGAALELLQEAGREAERLAVQRFIEYGPELIPALQPIFDDYIGMFSKGDGASYRPLLNMWNFADRMRAARVIRFPGLTNLSVIECRFVHPELVPTDPDLGPQVALQLAIDAQAQPRLMDLQDVKRARASRNQTPISPRRRTMVAV